MSTKRPITLQPEPAQEKQWEQIPESRADDVPETTTSEPGMVRLQPRKRTKHPQVPPKLIRRSGRLLERQKSQKPVGPVTRSKKGRAHSFITNQADDEDLSEDSEDDYNSEKIFGDTNDSAISAEPKSEECIYALINDEEIIEPSTIAEALQNPLWKKSMDNEMKALHDKETWDVVTPPSNANIVSCKWVYTCKKDSTRKVIQAKSRLVAQGFTQTFGVDYYEIYSPVVCLTSLRLIL